MLIKILIVLSATITVILPVIAPMVNPCNQICAFFKKWWRLFFVFTAILTFAGSLYEYNLAQKELFRLSSNDFQIRLTAIGRGLSMNDSIIDSLFPLHFYGELGSAFFKAEFVNVSEDSRYISNFRQRRDFRRTGLGGRKEITFRFYATNMTIAGLEDYPYLDDLDGESLTFEIDLRKFAFIAGEWIHVVDLYVMGRHFIDTVSSSGEVLIEIDI